MVVNIRTVHNDGLGDGLGDVLGDLLCQLATLGGCFVNLSCSGEMLSSPRNLNARFVAAISGM